jgi:hypothetical protein
MFENDPGVAYTEDRIRGSYYDNPDDIARWWSTLHRLQDLAHSIEDSRAAVQQRVGELTG